MYIVYPVYRAGGVPAPAGARRSHTQGGGGECKAHLQVSQEDIYFQSFFSSILREGHVSPDKDQYIKVYC